MALIRYPAGVSLGRNRSGLDDGTLGYRVLNLAQEVVSGFVTSVVETAVSGDYLVSGGVLLLDEDFEGMIQWGDDETWYANDLIGPGNPAWVAATLAALPAHVDETLTDAHGDGPWTSSLGNGTWPFTPTVVDEDAAPLPGATVSILNTALTSLIASAVTDASGRVVSFVLAPGDYTVLVSKPGYRAFTPADLTITGDGAQTASYTLEAVPAVAVSGSGQPPRHPRPW